VIVKAAASLDGRIAPSSGRSRWLTGEAARAAAHALRRRSDAVLVGIRTALSDDPLLTCRDGGPPVAPLRCVVDPDLRLPEGAALLSGADSAAGRGVLTPTQSAPAASRARLVRAGAEVVGLAADPDGGGLDLHGLLADLHGRGACSLLVEGGAITTGRFLAAGLADRLVLHVAPLLLGDRGVPAFAGLRIAELSQAVAVHRLDVARAGPDLLIDGVVEGGFDPAAMVAGLLREAGR
jgi:diaminohydroxyphosphoribosylaminopyrimidine deaminase/5-amino-6-(5-phosphoribosylamino)uracil reductase